MKILKKQILIFWLSLIVLLVPVFAVEINFDNTLDEFFNNLEDNYSEIHFNGGSNDFAGIIFRQGSDGLDNDVNLELASDPEDFDCSRVVRGLYYNPQRGNVVRPLDGESLEYLKDINSSYNNLTMSGGRYTNCYGKDDEDIYGQINHTLGSSTYKLVAGVEFSSSSNIYIQNFDNSLEYFEDNERAEGKIFDSWGGIAELIETIDGLEDFSITMIRNAEPGEYYTSDSIEIAGLNSSQEVLASISKGVLFINGDRVGTTGYVENNDEIEIELRSSSDYDAVTSSTLTIGTEQATFYIVTQPEGYNEECDLDLSAKMRVYGIFNLLTDAYDDNSIKLESFLYTMKSMLEDRIKDKGECGYYDYLLDITDSYIMNDMDVGGYNDNQGIYIAPNCKQYEVKYDDSRQAYYSPDFIAVHYFISTETLEAYVNEYNPGTSDCGVSYNNPSDGERRIAPNGKVYKIIKIAESYTSEDFIYAKTFDTLEGLRKYIDLNNPAQTVRNHELDNAFEKLVYLAPNGKEYIIQRVFVSGNEKYMSYKFITPKYFDSLDSIKNFIDKNNPA